MTGNYKSEFAIPTCFSTGSLSFKGIFDLIVFYLVLYLVNNGNCQIIPPEKGEGKTYFVELSKEVFNDLCPRYANKGSSYTRLRNALKNASLSINGEYLLTVPIFTFREYSNATLRLRFNAVFTHIFEKMRNHLKSDEKTDRNNQIRYTGFTLFDIKELCTMKTFYQARTFEFLHAKAYNRRSDYIPGKKDLKIKILEYYFALGKLENKINSSYNGFAEQSECRLSETEVTTQWKHVNEEVFSGKSLKIHDSELIEAKKTEKDVISFTITDLRSQFNKKDTDKPAEDKNAAAIPLARVQNTKNNKAPSYIRHSPKKNDFLSHKGRKYDFDALEKERQKKGS